MRNRIITITLFVLMLSNSWAHSQDSIKIDKDFSFYSFGGKEYVVINLSYINESKSNLYLWIQNWRLSVVNGKDPNYLKDWRFSVNVGLLNSIALYNIEGKSINQRGFEFNDLRNDTLLNCSFVKYLAPSSKFSVKIISTDSLFIDILKNRKKEYNMLVYYSYVMERDIDTMNLKKELLYNKDELYILHDEFVKHILQKNYIPLNVTTEEGVKEEKVYEDFRRYHFPSRRAHFILK